jgi:hypothetical protein
MRFSVLVAADDDEVGQVSFAVKVFQLCADVLRHVSGHWRQKMCLTCGI